MKVYFVTTNEKKAEESKARLERFIERVPSQERARLQIELCIVKRQLDELLAARGKSLHESQSDAAWLSTSV